jgi:predicted aspartyl protease
MRIRILLSVAVVVSAFNASRVRAAGETESLPFELTGTGQVVIPAMVNGAGPYKFLLDTGSTRSAISDAIAARLSLVPVAVSEMVTSNGTTTRPVATLKSISLGGRVTSDLAVLVLESRHLGAIDKEADGILGQDLLIDARYTIDYRRKRLTWLTGAGPESGIRLEVIRKEGRLLVALPQSSRPNDLAWMVPDSGASALVLFQRNGRTAVPANSLPATVATVTASNEGHARLALIPTLRIGKATLSDQPALVIAAAGQADSADGLLPLLLFSSVTFQGRENYLTIRP